MLAVWKYYLSFLACRRAFGVTLILALSLGIIPNTLAFLFLSDRVLKPLPIAGEEEVCELGISIPAAGIIRGPVDYGRYQDWQKRGDLFKEVAAAIPVELDLQSMAGTERLSGRFVSEAYFEVIGARPAIGGPIDHTTSTDPNCLISWLLWQEQFGGDPGITGRSLHLGGAAVTVAGVMPKAFSQWQRAISFWLPVSFLPQFAPRELIEKPGYNFTDVIARLRAGVTLDQARQGLSRSRQDPSNESHGRDDAGDAIAVETIRGATSDKGTIRTLALLQMSALFALLVACGNASSLVLASAIGRRSEMAVRAAMGATRARLLFEAACEALLIAGIASLLGAALVWCLIRLLQVYSPLISVAAPDWRVAATSVFVCGGLALLLWSSCILTIPQPTILCVESRTIGGRETFPRLRKALIGVQAALATGLLFLCLQVQTSAVRLDTVPVGFDPTSLYVLGLRLPEDRYSSPSLPSAYAGILEAVRSVPGIRSVSLVDRVGFPTVPFSTSLHLDDGRRFLNGEGGLAPTVYRVSPGYLRTLGLPFVAGRDFEGLNTRATAVASMAAQRAFWPDETAVGHRFKLRRDSREWIEITGVVADARYGGAWTGIGPVLYLPLDAAPSRNVQVILRVEQPATVQSARAALRRWDATVPILREGALNDWIRLSTQGTRATAIALLLLALLGGALAASGVHGMASLSLRQREQELAVRLSLGARPSDVAGRILAEVGIPAAVGIGIGLLVTVPLLGTVQHLLYGPAIPWSWALGGPAAAMVIVVLVAAGAVVGRTVRLSPAELLRTH